MKVIIKKTGVVKDVSFGYAANYLFPQGLAVKATENKIAKIKSKQKKARKARKQAEKESISQADKLNGKKIVFKVKTGKSDKIHGSITKKDIAKKIDISSQEVVLKKPIKKIGRHKVIIKLEPGQAKAEVEVVVKKETKKK